MDCRTARLLLDFHRPRAGELPPEEAVELERHLAGCPDCDAAGRTARRLDDHLGAAIRDVPIPDGLRDRLLSRLHEDRSGRLTRRLAWTARGLVVAAALLVATLLWLHFRPEPPPELNVPKVSKVEGDNGRLNSPESVAAWFKERHHITMDPPPMLNYRCLVDCDVAEVQGKPVPRLVFSRDWDSIAAEKTPTRAAVYVVSQDQFNLDALRKWHEMPVDDFSQPIQVWSRETEGRKTVYLVLYNGDLNKVMLDEPGA
jgi:hypothetical protein